MRILPIVILVFVGCGAAGRSCADDSAESRKGHVGPAAPDGSAESRKGHVGRAAPDDSAESRKGHVGPAAPDDSAESRKGHVGPAAPDDSAESRKGHVGRAAPDGSAESVVVRVLSRNRLQHAQLFWETGSTELRAAGTRIQVDGELHDRLDLPSRPFTLRAGGVQRSYEGSLTVRARAGVLLFSLRMPLERYVAEVVAAETDPGTPAAALRAQAIVSRSYALSAGARHDDADLCDLAHCQVHRGADPTAHGRAAAAAAKATKGRALRLPDGAVAHALFHSSCGGRTADPVAVFGIPDRTGAASVDDPGCEAHGWETLAPRAEVDAAVIAILGQPIASLHTRREADGRLARVQSATTSLTGELFARSLDRALGWGHIRSAIVRWQVDGAHIRFVGRGAGHGVGLCQRGARRRAEAGADDAAILRHYFPGAKLHSTRRSPRRWFLRLRMGLRRRRRGLRRLNRRPGRPVGLGTRRGSCDPAFHDPR